jgi:hypothetical protein
MYLVSVWTRSGSTFVKTEVELRTNTGLKASARVFRRFTSLPSGLQLSAQIQGG